jgi:diguanylate cyclase (GGDEF)-like protein
MRKTLMQRLEASHPVAVAILVVVLSGLIGLADYESGYEYSFAIFYVVPVLFAAWLGGRLLRNLVVVLCAVLWLAADIASGHLYSSAHIPFWNAVTRLAVFLLIASLAATVKRLLEREKALARRDPLTATLNARAFRDEGQRLMALSRRSGQPMSIAYLDLDNFKTVNDQMGHDAGDRVIQRVAEAVAKAMRSSDLVGRLGGDEFAILLPDAGEGAAARTLLRLRGTLSGLVRGHGWPISVSIGLVTFESVPASLDEGITLADRAMYEVKGTGKDGLAHYVLTAGGVRRAVGGGQSAERAQSGSKR